MLKLADAQCIFIIGPGHAFDQTINLAARQQNFPSCTQLLDFKKFILFIKISEKPVFLPIMHNHHRAFIIFSLFPWLKPGIIILSGGLSPKTLHAEKHGLDELMQRCLSRLILTVDNIDPRLKLKLLIVKRTKMGQIQCFDHHP